MNAIKQKQHHVARKVSYILFSTVSLVCMFQEKYLLQLTVNIKEFK